MGVRLLRAWVSKTEGMGALYPIRDQKRGPLLGAGAAKIEEDHVSDVSGGNLSGVSTGTCGGKRSRAEGAKCILPVLCL